MSDDRERRKAERAERREKERASTTNDRREEESNQEENKLVGEIDELKITFNMTIDKLAKDIKRQDKIMSRADKRQRKEYDELQDRLVEVTALQESQKKLMDSFIELIAGAIDAKSKYTGGHCIRVPELSMMLVKEASNSDEEPFKEFKLESEDELRELNIASLLHDCGKVTTPEYIVDKATKLETIYNRIHEVRTRFEVIHRDLTIEALEKKLAGEDVSTVDAWLEVEHKKLVEEYEILAIANVGGEYMKDESKEKIREIASRTWVRNFDDTLGLAHEEKQRVLLEKSETPAVEQLLSDKKRHIIEREYFDYEEYERFGFKTKVPENLYDLGELTNICISAGTLTYEDRFKIQEHVVMSIKMLEQLPFPENLKNVPLYAGSHHETLIGTGYPRQLSAEDMSIPARVMAIADVFEALTASDRPYKEPKTLSASVKILSFMAKDKHLDPDLFKLFLSSGIYKEYAKDRLKPEQIDEVDISQYL
ncbi:MAG: HD domain-containing protein [Helicobacteraceae bacterium]|nr:HD domain-containing protein [Helicobacteraceae bacterium]